MKPKDLLLFLFGNRQSIERIAATPHAWIIGALLVLSAGLARNYDHLDLLRDPEWFVGPFAASIFSTFFIYIWLLGPLRLQKVGGFWRQLLVFLNLVWLTAPCAWIYGIPVESFTDILTATKWNIAFLAIVSFWRVAIMVRAVSVLTGVVWMRALPLVLAPAAMEMMVGAGFKKLSIIGIMGGVRLPPDTQLLYNATAFTQVASFWVMIASMVAILLTKGKAASPLDRKPTRLNPATILLAASFFIVWLVIAVGYEMTS